MVIKLSTFFLLQKTKENNMNKERLTEILNIKYDDLSTIEKIELTEFYKYIYNTKGCSNCKDKTKSYYEKLSENGIQLLTENETKFKLRSDIGVNQIEFDGLIISQSSSDNNACILFLKANPARISLFEKYPENWMDLLTQNNENETINE
jgi:hypothetical protein